MSHLSLPSRSVNRQTIEFPINEDNTTVGVFSQDVTIVLNSSDHITGSSKVKLNNIVDYSWEEKFYRGQLLAVHVDGNYIAYGIKVGSNYAVRVVNRETSKRALIKGMGGIWEDLAFAFIPNQVTLACVDEAGSVFVHNIHESAKDITTTLVLHIQEISEVTVPRRIFWCPYIPDEPDIVGHDPYDETSLLLAVTRDNQVEVWNVLSASSLGHGPVRSDRSVGSCVIIPPHDATIVDAAFSPDGTAIATASLDGECKFYQVYMQSEGDPTCLHQWKPHGGKPVTFLAFLDDHKASVTPEVKFWKYAVTGTDDNCEISLWTCESWKCLQTFRFTTKNNKQMKLKAAVDLSAGYIFVSDMFHRVLYVMELEKTKSETVPFVKTITEFLFPCPILSFGIVDAEVKSLKGTHHLNTSFPEEELPHDSVEEEDNQTAVFVRMYLVQPKSLQECNIVFQTSSPVIQNNIPSYPKEVELESVSSCLDSSATSLPGQPQTCSSLNLMTPDAFHTPHTAESTPIISRNGVTPIPESALSFPSGSLVLSNGEPPCEGVGGGGGGEKRRGFTSGGSSPSREVQQILSSPRYYAESAAALVAPPAQAAPPPHSPGLVPASINPPPPGHSVADPETLKNLSSSIASLKTDLDRVSAILSSHSTEFQSLREELKRCRTGPSLSELETVVSRTVGSQLAAVEGMLANTMAPLINHAVLSNVNPLLLQSVAGLNETVHKEVSQKLTSSDSLIKDNINRLMRSKQFMEMMTKSMTAAASGVMEPLFRESFVETALPLFEGACSSMFRQMNEIFSKGVNEGMKEIEKYACKLTDRANMEVLAIQSASERLSQTSEHFSSSVDKQIKGLEEVVGDTERRLKVCLNGATCSVRSGTVTPALVDPHLVQSQVAQLIAQGQYNTAFQQALSASDLSIVSYACDKVDVSKVFTRCGSVLQQHVLLSLIQQLAADMTSHTENKQRYLEEAVMNLLPSNENTREHMPQVLTGLQKQLQLFVSSSTEPRLVKKARMLSMVCQQLIQNLKEDWD